MCARMLEKMLFEDPTLKHSVAPDCVQSPDHAFTCIKNLPFQINFCHFLTPSSLTSTLMSYIREGLNSNVVTAVLKD